MLKCDCTVQLITNAILPAHLSGFFLKWVYLFAKHHAQFVLMPSANRDRKSTFRVHDVSRKGTHYKKTRQMII